MFQIAKDAARSKQIVYLGVERPFPFVNEMMDGETGNDRIELAQVWKWTFEVVGHDSHRGVATKAFLRGCKHRGRKINRHRGGVRVVHLDQGKQASVARTEVEDAPHRWSDEFQKCGFAFHAVRNRVRAAQVVEGVFSRGPEIDAHSKSINSNPMDKLKTERKGFRAAFPTQILILFLLSALAWGQTGQSSEPQKDAGEGARATQDISAHEQKISPQEAEKLFRSVDEILKFASRDTLLPIRHEVKRRLVDREEIEAYVTKHISEDEDAKRLRRSELVLKKFGLLPRDFDLGKFLVVLLKEQVAGYYDPKTKTVNLLDWLGAEQQKPVLAHELTHALQDQSFNLEKYMKPADADLEKKKEITSQDIDNDEISTTRQAVVEGQAMVVLVDYMLEPMGLTLKDSPQVVQTLKDGMLVGTADAVQFHNAPIYMKEALTFPYRFGIDFITELMAKGGKEKAFAALFENPPRTTRQIMEPQTYLAGERLEPMRLPDFRQVFKNDDRFDVGAVGEFDVAVLIDQYAGAKASTELYPHWRGGYYYAVRPKSDPAAPLGLLYVSRWSNAERAADFAGIYAKAIAKRYLHVHDVEQPGKGPLVRTEALDNLTGRRAWLTEDGPVVINMEGDTVLITESLEQATTEALELEVFRAAAVAGK